MNTFNPAEPGQTFSPSQGEAGGGLETSMRKINPMRPHLNPPLLKGEVILKASCQDFHQANDFATNGLNRGDM